MKTFNAFTMASFSVFYKIFLKIYLCSSIYFLNWS